jgi:hypothetical protein
VANATWWVAMMIKAGVGDLVQRIRDDQAHDGYLVARRLGGRVTLYVIHIIHMEETRSVGSPV